MSLFIEQDYKQLEERGITPSEVERQLEIFRRGARYADLDRPAVIGDGITAIDDDLQEELLRLHKLAAGKGRIGKFVPASGAASRMFKALTEFYNRKTEFGLRSIEELKQSGDETTAYVNRFIHNFVYMAFFGSLQKCMIENNIDMDRIQGTDKYRLFLEYLLTEKGLNYGKLPKGLIEFHKYKDETRTPFREHLAEGAEYTQDGAGTARAHFTVAEEFRNEIQEHVEEYCRKLVDTGKVKHFEVSYSVQKKATDTIAVDMDNRPFRDDAGRLVFRPGGHGALIENLHELQGDIVIINNIDNVRVEGKMADTYLYRKLLTGMLVSLQERAFKYLMELEAGEIKAGDLREIAEFAEKELMIDLGERFSGMSANDRRDNLFQSLNRPMRVCGMVENTGEPGGGPFWVKGRAGTVSLQIVETSQIDKDNPEQNAILQSATHFNPVDLVCGLKDYRGNNFDLKKYIDPETVFISVKSKDGRDLKALELPGLWNGAMADWITVFTEVPLSTFSPVKTVNDLLKEMHR